MCSAVYGFVPRTSRRQKAHSLSPEAEWLASSPVFTQRHFEELIEQSRKVERLDPPNWYGPEVAMLDRDSKVRFLVHTPMGWERIYYLNITITADGRVDQQAGQIVADLGQGEIF